jgi:anti-sigma-K factor RskA
MLTMWQAIEVWSIVSCGELEELGLLSSLCCNADIIRLGLDPESKQSLESKSMLRIRVLPGGCSVNPWNTVCPILNRFS